MLNPLNYEKKTIKNACLVYVNSNNSNQGYFRGVMRIESKLCHLSENKAVVLVKAWHNNKSLGSALAEGSTVEVAEDKAILRLNKRINAITNNVASINSNNEETFKTPLKVELPKSEKLKTLIKNQSV